MKVPHRAITIIEALEFWAEVQPDKILYRFMPEGEGEVETVTYRQALQGARAIASHLQHWRGERALLLFHSGLEFLQAFLGCLYAGVIAVPAYPPRRNHNLERLQAIVEDCLPKIVLTTDKIRQFAEPLFVDAFRDAGNAGLRDLRWIEAERVIGSDAGAFSGSLPLPNDIAFLQYTSGSTGNPKGVMVSHDNLIYNEEIIHSALDVDADYHVVGWLPLFHDMGLIGLALYPLYIGIDALIMPPAVFLQKPFRWLKAISDMAREGPVGTVAPNFAWQLCVEQITDEQRRQLDLSGLKFALTGAEPVRAATLDAFTQRFAGVGFRSSAFCPCYGLAEATLMVSCASAREPVRQSFDAQSLARHQAVAASHEGAELVSSGRSQLAQQIVIVDPASGQPVGQSAIGEIWVSGRHIPAGYWNLPDVSAVTFHGFTSDGRGPYLRTGDLGVYLDGELFVTGRLKDMIIIRGRNIYPQDIEFAVENAHAVLRSDSGAAFSIDVDNEEKLVVVIEVERAQRFRLDPEIIFWDIRRAVAGNFDVQLHAIVLLKPGSILKTSSGKIQRNANRRAYLDGSLAVLAQWQDMQTSADIELLEQVQPVGEFAEQSEASLQQWIVQWLAHNLRIDVRSLDVHAPLTSHGIDSIDAIRLMGALETWAGYPIDPTIVWEHDSIARLAVHLVSAGGCAGDASSPDIAVFEGTL